MKILIFENEISKVLSSFNDVNELDFDNALKITFVEKSQALSDYKDTKNYDIIFVDIDLSSTSKKDGYGVINDIINYGNRNIVIMTGHNVHEELKKRNMSEFKVIKKPLFLEELSSVISSFAQ